MNAGGVPNPCKSSDLLAIAKSGGRVSNTWETYLGAGNNFAKAELIPKRLDGSVCRGECSRKGVRAKRVLRPIS